MLILDDEAVYRYANDALCRAARRPRETIIGQRVGFLSTPDRRGDAQRAWRLLMERNHIVIPWKFVRPDGSVVSFDVAAATNLPSDGLHLTVHLSRGPAPDASRRLSPRELEVTT